MKNHNDRLKEIEALKADLERVKELQRQYHELLVLQQELEELKSIIDDINDQNHLQIIKGDARD